MLYMLKQAESQIWREKSHVRNTVLSASSHSLCRACAQFESDSERERSAPVASARLYCQSRQSRQRRYRCLHCGDSGSGVEHALPVVVRQICRLPLHTVLKFISISSISSAWNS